MTPPPWAGPTKHDSFLSHQAEVPENILVLVPDLHREFHGWKSGACTPKDVLVFIEAAGGDLFDPVNSRDMKRLRALTPPAAAV